MKAQNKFYNYFSMDQIKVMSTSELYNHVNRYKNLIEDLHKKNEDSVQAEREFCYLERERLKRESGRK